MPIHQVHFGPFSIEDEPIRLRRGADLIQLRPKSLEVLKYLAERPGQFVSKEELLKRVWVGRVINDTGLRVCVREIRAVLGDNADMPYYLETIVGHGFRFLEGRNGRALFPDTTGPIVGRESELRQLEDYYQLAADGHSQFVLLGGEPGIGKTTLLNCFLDRVAEQPTMNVIQAQCVVHFGKSEAYGVVLEAIAHLVRDPNMAKVLKRFAPTWLLQMPGLLDPVEFEQLQSQVSGVTSERMTREFCQAVEELAKLVPLIIVIEDLHWADISTIDLLASLARVPKLITPRVVVNVYPDGSLADERGRAMNEATLRAYLQDAAVNEPDVRLLVRPDRSVAHASVQQLLREARKAGIYDIIFAAYTSDL